MESDFESSLRYSLRSLQTACGKRPGLRFGMEDGIIQLGERETWGGKKPFGILPVDRRQHLYTVGKSGTGKTTLLKNLIIQDMQAGRGVGVIDPHGDLATELLDFVPPRRLRDVAYFNPSDTEFPIGFNLLAGQKEQRHLVASGVVSAMKSIWSDFWGPRLEYILHAAVSALLECRNASLLGIQRMLTDGSYRAWVVRQVKDPAVRSFWVNEFEGYDRRFLNEAVAPIQNKIGRLFMSPHLRNILGQVRRTIDARFMMDNRRIFIADLSKGKLGADKSNFLGALLVTQFQLAAMSRADVVEDARNDFHLFVDEFQNFATDSFIGILSEARKYRLCLTLSHQYIEQLRPEIRSAVFGNVGSFVTFRVGERDTEVLGREVGGCVSARVFTDLPNFEVIAKLLINGEQQEPFTGRTGVPKAIRYGRRESIIQFSRERYATERYVVEEKIHRWLSGMK
jgi:hypothetical protein